MSNTRSRFAGECAALCVSGPAHAAFRYSSVETLAEHYGELIAGRRPFPAISAAFLESADCQTDQLGRGIAGRKGAPRAAGARHQITTKATQRSAEWRPRQIRGPGAPVDFASRSPATPDFILVLRRAPGAILTRKTRVRPRSFPSRRLRDVLAGCDGLCPSGVRPGVRHYRCPEFCVVHTRHIHMLIKGFAAHCEMSCQSTSLSGAPCAQR